MKNADETKTCNSRRSDDIWTDKIWTAYNADFIQRRWLEWSL